MKNEIKKIIIEEFSKLITNIEDDFKKNYKKKNHNFLLSELDDEMTANMVFVSSFESKSGNAIQECARRIAILKYGKKNVPRIINPHNLDINNINIDEENLREQLLVTDVDLDNDKLQSGIQGFMTLNQAKGRGKNRTKCNVTQNTIKELLDLSKYKDGKIHLKPVDLAFFDGNDWNIIEIKAGGDLDSSNAPGNAKKMLTIYVGLNCKNSKLYFATIYHKDGEGNNWSGSIKKYLSYPDMFLIGSQFWNKILPDGINFKEFTKIYGEAIKEINLNSRLRLMIQDCIK
ncbi:TdeIII family type II restriction endonuclease [Caminicella sporogenes]|uniref:TdeIII family type II restriction endonuclease n=1 Tax=Caminicella sporogenes TaxID=166485 RepID=UPI0025414DE1|nr:TdeIII family type II restriction endonuclease [Caminicella sporogenes]WIF96189.1 TdeIII family type II restriction endonuclease [Caminicella sporogenes]